MHLSNNIADEEMIQERYVKPLDWKEAQKAVNEFDWRVIEARANEKIIEMKDEAPKQEEKMQIIVAPFF